VAAALTLAFVLGQGGEHARLKELTSALRPFGFNLKLVEWAFASLLAALATVFARPKRVNAQRLCRLRAVHNQVFSRGIAIRVLPRFLLLFRASAADANATLVLADIDTWRGKFDTVFAQPRLLILTVTL